MHQQVSDGKSKSRMDMQIKKSITMLRRENTNDRITMLRRTDNIERIIVRSSLFFVPLPLSPLLDAVRIFV